ncbi:MAG: hypothetical protein KAY32_06015 [Candidatus Eisenbacteria sp.]|nr:hypothetical protein [Candidatus Eisenbacteria bacterium]
MKTFPLSSELREYFAHMSAKALSELAFVTARPLGGGFVQPPDWAPLGARLRFGGALRGALEIWVPERIAAALTDNIFGPALDATPEDNTRADSHCDALMETLSRICGALLGAVAEGERPYHLGTPGRCRRPMPAPPGGEEIEAWLEVEGDPVLVRMGLAPGSS